MRESLWGTTDTRSKAGPEKLTFAYNYAYTPAGKVSSKTLAVLTADGVHICCPAFNWIPDSASLTASYTYDNQGALTSMGYTYPLYPGGSQVFTYTLDAMERPISMTDNLNEIYASGATYNAANQPLNDGTGTRTYNNLLQVTSMTGLGMNMTYNYPSSQNNGQIASSVDAVTGETITYQYDALKRLQSASGKNWGETYTYDGYGNLTQMNPTGTAGAPSLSVNVALDSNNVPTNRIAATGVEMKDLTRRDPLRTGPAVPAAAAAAAMPTHAAEPASGALRERLLLDFGWRFHLGHAADTTQDFGFRHFK